MGEGKSGARVGEIKTVVLWVAISGLALTCSDRRESGYMPEWMDVGQCESGWASVSVRVHAYMPV